MSAEAIRQQLDQIYREQSRRVFATLVRLLDDIDLAEEALHEAFAAAAAAWPREGRVPENPAAWLVSTGRFKAIDALRRRGRFNASLAELSRRVEHTAKAATTAEESPLPDDQLRLIFTCCHPALAPNTQVALTLREVCGLSTDEIASAFLTTSPTIAQRIVRGKAKIRDARIPYEVPSVADLPERIDAVLSVVYLVFSEGYAASSGESLTRSELSEEAIRLGRLLTQLLPDPEVMGLLALMLLQESRRGARTSPSGELILLENQDRALWNQERIVEGLRLVAQALASRQLGPYTLQAAIAAVHARSASIDQTDWPQIVALYDLLLRASPSPVVELNRAVAVAMHEGPAAGLTLIDTILTRGQLTEYPLAHAARADLCRRLGDSATARSAYEQALALTRQQTQRQFLERRLAELG